MTSQAELFQKRRQWVNNEYSKRVSGTHMSNRKKTILFNMLWKKAKRRYK